MENQQSSSLTCNCNDEGKGSTTISEESTGIENTGKRSVYLRKRNVIYKIFNNIDSKFYIGSASYYDKRLGQHISALRRQTHCNNYLQNAWNKYGEKSFSFSIIEEVDCKENLIRREQYYLDLYKTYNIEFGYNINKLAESNLGTKMPESAKIKIGNFWRGKKFSQERINYLKKHRTLIQGKSISVYDKNFNLLYIYPSISETSRQLKVSIAAISKCCSRNRITPINKKEFLYIFRYKDIV